MADRMFSEHSFTDEIDSPQQAEEGIEYLAKNEHQFRQELQDEGLSYDDVVLVIEGLWRNLAAACKRVGYTDPLIEQKKERYGLE